MYILSTGISKNLERHWHGNGLKLKSKLIICVNIDKVYLVKRLKTLDPCPEVTCGNKQLADLLQVISHFTWADTNILLVKKVEDCFGWGLKKKIQLFSNILPFSPLALPVKINRVNSYYCKCSFPMISHVRPLCFSRNIPRIQWTQGVPFWLHTTPL